MGLPCLRQIDRAFGGARQRRLVDLEGGNLAAQHRIFQTALLVAADRIRGNLAERPADWRGRPADWPPTRYETKRIAGVPVFLRLRRR